MSKLSLTALARRLRSEAAQSGSGRAAAALNSGHERQLRQTLIVLEKDAVMSEHESPGEATVFVLAGRVRLQAGEHHWDGAEADVIFVPAERHSLVAVEDSEVLLTVARCGPGVGAPES